MKGSVDVRKAKGTDSSVIGSESIFKSRNSKFETLRQKNEGNDSLSPTNLRGVRNSEAKTALTNFETPMKTRGHD